MRTITTTMVIAAFLVAGYSPRVNADSKGYSRVHRSYSGGPQMANVRKSKTDIEQAGEADLRAQLKPEAIDADADKSTKTKVRRVQRSYSGGSASASTRVVVEEGK